MIMKDASSADLVWHYTTLATLIKVLETRTLFSTEVSFLNDIRETEAADSVFDLAIEAVVNEGKAGASSLAYWIRTLRDHESDHIYSNGLFEEWERSRFILCGSDDPDSLYAWRTYASRGDVACAIGLDRSVALSPQRAQCGAQGNWVRVNYESKELLSETIAKLDAVRKEHVESLQSEDGGPPPFEAIEILGDLRSRCKDGSFAQEREYRITHTRPFQHLVSFLPHEMGPRPHLPLGVPVSSNTGGIGNDWELLPIREVKLGPDAPQSAIASARWMLEANGYSMHPEQKFERDDRGRPQFSGLDASKVVRVSESKLPYRNA